MLGTAPTYVEKALHTQAHWFIYAQMSPPFSALIDPEFREMLKSMVPEEPGYMKVKRKPILTKNDIKKYIDAEMELFHKFLNEMLQPLVEESFGNPFVQILHDAVTLSNKFKYYSIAIQFVDSEWECNHVVAISFGQIVSSSAATVTPKIKEKIKSTTGFT